MQIEDTKITHRGKVSSNCRSFVRVFIKVAVFNIVDCLLYNSWHNRDRLKPQIVPTSLTAVITVSKCAIFIDYIDNMAPLNAFRLATLGSSRNDVEVLVCDQFA